MRQEVEKTPDELPSWNPSDFEAWIGEAYKNGLVERGFNYDAAKLAVQKRWGNMDLNEYDKKFLRDLEDIHHAYQESQDSQQGQAA